MDDRDVRRAVGTRELARLVRSPMLRPELARRGAAPGGVSFIAALPDDPMGYVFDRLGEVGHSAVVVVSEGGHMRCAVVHPTPNDRAQRVKSDDVAPVHDDSSVGMFLDYLDKVGTLVTRRIEAAIMDSEQLQGC